MGTKLQKKYYSPNVLKNIKKITFFLQTVLCLRLALQTASLLPLLTPISHLSHLRDPYPPAKLDRARAEHVLRA